MPTRGGTAAISMAQSHGPVATAIAPASWKRDCKKRGHHSSLGYRRGPALNPSSYHRMKTVLITGANRGIGFETGRQLAVRGFPVVLGARSHEQGQKALRELAPFGKVSLCVVDVSDSTSIAN